MSSTKNSEQLRAGYERVFTVTDYYDGPRRGIADYRGRPHFYDCVFDSKNDEYSDLYLLTPLEQTAFELALEDWEIWCRWEMAFHQGKTSLDTHPCQPQDRSRHEELAETLRGALKTNPDTALKRIGQFKVLGTPNLPKGVLRPLQVKWASPLDLDDREKNLDTPTVLLY